MKPILCPPRRCAGMAALLTGLLFAASLGAPPRLSAQSLPLPALDLTVTPASEEMIVQWPEVAANVGRRIANIQQSWAQDTAAVASDFEIVGEFVQDCDYRLRIAKIPQDPGLNRRLLLLAQLFENTTNTGAPLRVDTLRIVTPDSTHSFRVAFAGNLGIRVSGNIDPPSGPLGTIPVTVGGVNSTIAESVGYFCTARNTVTDISQGLQVFVAGPVNLASIPNPLPPQVPRTTLTFTSTTQVLPIMDAMTLRLGTGSAAPGDTVTWTARQLFPPAGRVLADLEAFEGYHVWRSDLPDVNSFTLLGEIQQCESKFEFILVDEDDLAALDVELRYDPAGRTFTVIDRDVHDDFPYRYAVSTFDRGFLGNREDLTFEGPLSTSGKFYPALQSRDRTRGKIYVVPNPFKRHSDFQEGDAKVVFANLPDQCTIRVYTEALDHVVTLTHGLGEPRSTSPTSREWNLRSDSGAPIRPGIYIFHVEGTNRFDAGGTEATEAVEQIGKFVVVR